MSLQNSHVQKISNKNEKDAQFLMPEDYVKEVFYKIINVKPDSVIEKHVIKMNNFFKVSYKAMLKRLVQLNLCQLSNYERKEKVYRTR
jgi:Zn-dependent peptidase ImmA (M78 family)